MIFTLARGHYCPRAHRPHRELAAFQSKLAVADSPILTIATNDHHDNWPDWYEHMVAEQGRTELPI